MSNPLLDLSSKDELITSLLSGNKPASPKETPIGERKTFKVQSDLLARLEDFLPKMKEANAQLDQKLKEDPKSLDIENVDEESGEQYIEMDLGLGVFDLKKDVKEEDIVINPSDIQLDKPAVKPAIVMMDVDKNSESDDHGDSDEDSEGSAKKQQIPANKSTRNSSVTEDEDVIMSP